MSKLQNKVAVITGGTSGIGLAAAERFIAEGAHVYITGRRQAELDAALAKLGPQATGVRGDVSDLADLDRLYDAVKAGHGRVDVVFANAGGGTLLPLGQITEEQVDRTFDINVKGLIFTVQKALPLMAAGGTVVLNASTTSIMGTPAFSVYSATKAAVRALARSWVYDLKDTGIRVNVLSPGPTRTPALEGVVPNADEVFSAAVPMGRLGDPDEVAKVAVFLASDDSSFVNGAELFVDGGLAQV